MTLYSMTDKFACLVGKKRKEATQQEKRQLAKQFLEAKKAECQSWIDNEVFDLVDMRKTKARNFVAGRWVLTVKISRRTHSRRIAQHHQEQASDVQPNYPLITAGTFIT